MLTETPSLPGDDSTIVAKRTHRRGTNAVVTATAALHDWGRLSTELTEVIGAGGVLALYKHTLYLTCKTHPCLTSLVEEPADPQVPFAHLACLEYCEAGEASAACEAFFTILTGIVDTLLGTAMTRQLLSSAWGENTPSDQTGEPVIIDKRFP